MYRRINGLADTHPTALPAAEKTTGYTDASPASIAAVSVNAAIRLVICPASYTDQGASY